MRNQSKVIAFDVDQASLISLRKALPDSVIEVVKGATAASLTRDWNQMMSRSQLKVTSSS